MQFAFLLVPCRAEFTLVMRVNNASINVLENCITQDRICSCLGPGVNSAPNTQTTLTLYADLNFSRHQARQNIYLHGEVRKKITLLKVEWPRSLETAAPARWITLPPWRLQQ